VEHSVFLCIDHINGDGAQERRLLKGYQVYNKLLKLESDCWVSTFVATTAISQWGSTVHVRTTTLHTTIGLQRRMSGKPTMEPVGSEPHRTCIVVLPGSS